MEFTELIGDLVQLARDETALNAGAAGLPRRGQFRHSTGYAGAAHGLAFDVELDPFYVVGDSDMLERAVTNLLDNAVKWSPPGGTIRVQLEGDRLRVADQGPGIAEADLPHRLRPVLPRRHRPQHPRDRPRAVDRRADDHPARRLGRGRPLGPGRRRVHRPAARRTNLEALAEPTAQPAAQTSPPPTPGPPPALAESGRKRQG